MHVSVAFLRAYHSVLLDLGFREVEQFALPDDPVATLPWSECARRLDRTLTAIDEPALGLIVGERMSVSALHLVGHLLLTSRTLREAADHFVRFAPLIWSNAEFTMEEASDEAYFCFAPPPLDLRAEMFCTELVLCITLNVASVLRVSDEAPLHVSLRYSAPAHAPCYERVFGCPVRFSAPSSHLAFSRTLLDESRRLPDQQLKEVLRERAELLLSRGGRRTDIVLRVRDWLRSQRDARFDLDSVAQALSMSPSTLRRKLAERGAAFSALVDEVRRELACDALRSESYDIKELSGRLGFSEPRAFHRAFRRWTGTTPARFRAAHAG